MEIVVIALAVLVGVVLGALGGGGSILMVPLLVYVAGIDANEAIATSLLVVGVTSAGAAIPHARAGRVEWSTAATFGAAGMVGAYVGGRVGANLPGSVLLGAFAVMMAAMAFAMLRGNGGPPQSGEAVSTGWTKLLGYGLVVGAVTGLVGAGGGFLVVPALVLLAGLSMRAAIGTSLVFIAMNSAAGFAGHLSTTSVDVPRALTIAAAATAGAFVGAKLAGHISSDGLRRVFGWFVLVMSVVVIVQEVPSSVRLPVALAATTGAVALGVFALRSRAAHAQASQNYTASTDRSPTMHVITVETPALGDRTYVIHDGQVALVVDPQRDLDRLEQVLAENELQLAAVFETHIHNDYVSGGLELARQHDAAYHVAAADDVGFDRVSVQDGDTVTVGTLQVGVMHTPGHTPTHLSYVVSDGSSQVVCTGGSLLFGSVGRTDLVAEERTEELTRSQHRSARRLAEVLDDDVAVLPTHGFGSFCSSGDTTGADSSTIGQERRENQALLVDDEDAFVAELLAGLDSWPAYYVHMAPMNRAGAGPIDLSPVQRVDVTELQRRMHAGEWVVDLRSRQAFADGHLVGTINVEGGDSFSTYLGWIIPWGTPLTLIGEAHDDVAEAQRQLVRIGIDRPAGSALYDDVRDDHAGSYRVARFDDLRAARAGDSPLTVLDTRRDGEWAESHVPGAMHIPLHELLERMAEVPAGPVWVHCASGYRASIAASLLARAGLEVVLIDEDVAAARELMATA